MWANTSQFTVKDNNEIVSRRYFLLHFSYKFGFALAFLYFPGASIMYEELLYGYIVYNLNILGKSFQRL